MLSFNNSAEEKSAVKNSQSIYKKYIAPVVVITIICLVVTGILAYTYRITKPIIDKNSALEANQARAAVFSGAGSEGFTEMTLEEADKLAGGKDLNGVNGIYVANNNKGMVIATEDKGFGGRVAVMTGINSAGEITGVKVTEHSETPGLGTKATTVEYLSQYKDKTDIDNSEGAADNVKIDAVTGATLTSNAVYRAVDKALAAYKTIGGVPNGK